MVRTLSGIKVDRKYLRLNSILSSPQTAAISFWNALRRADIDLAKKHYLTPEEIKQIGIPELDERCLTREFQQLQNDHIPAAAGSEWLYYQTKDVETFQGMKLVEGQLFFRKDGKRRRIGIALLHLPGRIWKITDAD